MKKRYKILILIIVLVLIFISFYLTMNQNRIKKYITGKWTSTLITIADGEKKPVTRQYIFNEDQTITYNVFRSDETFDSYDYGKYIINGKKIVYKNPNYERGFGAKNIVLEFNSKEDNIFEMTSGPKQTFLNLIFHKDRLVRGEKWIRAGTDIVDIEIVPKKSCNNNVEIEKDLYYSFSDKKIYTYCIDEVIIQENSNKTGLTEYIKSKDNAVDYIIYNTSPISIDVGIDEESVQYHYDDFSIIKCHTTFNNNDIYIADRKMLDYINFCISDSNYQENKALIDIAYSYLKPNTKKIIIHKYEAKVESPILAEGYEIHAANETGEDIIIKDKSIISVDFYTSNLSVPNNYTVIIDANTKEFIGFPYLD